MGKTVRIRNLVLGEGRPAICVPVVGRKPEEILSSVEAVLVQKPDIIEWRMDYLEEIQKKAAVTDIVKALRGKLGDVPLLCTLRTAAEGGEQEINRERYSEIYEQVMETGCADAIDVELFRGDELVKSLIEKAHQAGVKVIGSNHDFQKTPEKQEIISRLRRMQQLGMDVAKIAVMPGSMQDVLCLLEATAAMKEKYNDTPVITMAMGGRGVISRLAGEVFGSAVTFGMVGQASAPGQIPVKELRDVLEILHRYGG